MERERIEEIAANRLQIITPLLDPALDKAKHQTIKESISIQYGVGYGLIKNHCMIDGNKRIGTHAMLVFLALNGIYVFFAFR